MRKLVMICMLTVLMLAPAVSDAVVRLELGGSFHKPTEGQVGVAPLFTIAPQLGLPFEFGLTVADLEDSTHESILFVRFGTRTWKWDDGKKSVTLNLSVGTDVTRGSELQSKRLMLDGEYDGGRIDGVSLIGRVYRDRAEKETSWGVHLAVAVDFYEILGSGP